MKEQLQALLEQVAGGAVTPGAALERLRHLPLEDLGLARLDHHRALRSGRPEVVLASHKTTAQVLAIAERLAAVHGGFLCTRVTADQASALAARFPTLRVNEAGRTAWLPALEAEAGDDGATGGPQQLGPVAVVTAGTSDIPVAEEAAATAEAFGIEVIRVYDAGVAGLHRILAARPEIERARVVIVAAGMEGALPSVVGGLVGQPVIAVPTSVGYGASFGGIAALLGMLNSCADGVTVVNIDNGFGAAAAAARILSAGANQS